MTTTVGRAARAVGRMPRTCLAGSAKPALVPKGAGPMTLAARHGDGGAVQSLDRLRMNG